MDPLLEVTTAKSVVPVTAQNPKVSASSSNNQKPPPLVISNAPLVPLGPRPDTPLTSPFGAGAPQWPQVNNNAASTTTTSTPSSSFGGKPQNPSQWPQPHPVGGVLSTSTTTLKPSFQQNSHNLPQPSGAAGQPNLAPGFSPYHPPKAQPSGLDLSYGGGFNPGTRPQQGGKPGYGLAPMTTTSTTSTTSTTTTARPQQLDFDLRGGFDSKKPGSPQTGKEDFPTLPAPRRPPVKEDFPDLPTPKSLSPTPSSPSSPSAWNQPLPASVGDPTKTPSQTPSNPSSPSAWNKPLPTPAGVPSSTLLPKAPTAGTNGGGVSFVPHTGTTTTVRPGFENQGNTLATDDEIRSLTETLYTKEVNSQLNYITVNPQGKTRSIDSTDEAPKP